MCAAPCSWRVRIKSKSLRWQSTSKIFNTTPPGKPKIVLTPSRRRDSQKISAPVNFILELLVRRLRLAMLREDFHHAVLADQLEFLNPLHFDFFVRRQIMFMLKFGELLLELSVLLIKLFQLWILIQEGDNRVFFFHFHTAGLLV